MILEYTIKQALTELNISKATLYYRINKFKSKMEPHILMRNGKKFISHEGMEILKTNDSLDSLPDSSDNCLDCSENEKQINNYAFNVLKMENEFLKLQIKEKDNQIQTLSRLIENSQLLLKHEQDKNTMLIEEEKSKKNRFWEILSKK